MNKLNTKFFLISFFMAMFIINLIQHSRAAIFYEDVNPMSWYAEAVEYVSNEGFFNGISSETPTFLPNGDMTRAMIINVFYKMEGEPKVNEKFCKFSDVNDDVWYYDAVNWANKNEILMGFPDGTFRPNQPVTRQEISTFIHKYIKNKNVRINQELVDKVDIKMYEDYENVGKWAEESLKFCIAYNLIQGSENKILPKNNASRAQCAMVVMRYSKNRNLFEKMEEQKEEIENKTENKNGISLGGGSNVTRKEIIRHTNISGSTFLGTPIGLNKVAGATIQQISNATASYLVKCSNSNEYTVGDIFEITYKANDGYTFKNTDITFLNFTSYSGWNINVTKNDSKLIVIYEKEKIRITLSNLEEKKIELGEPISNMDASSLVIPTIENSTYHSNLQCNNYTKGYLRGDVFAITYTANEEYTFKDSEIKKEDFEVCNTWKIKTLKNDESTLEVILECMIYENIFELLMDNTLENEDIVYTKGYYDVGDDGGAKYRITAEKNLECIDSYELKNGLYAEYVLEKERINVREIGAKGDGTILEDEMILKAYNKGIKKYEFSEGTYLISSNMARILELECDICEKDNQKEKALLTLTPYTGLDIAGNEHNKDEDGFWKWTSRGSKYADNGKIYVSDFKNEYIKSLNLPNQIHPDVKNYVHQYYNAWITDYNILTDGDGILYESPIVEITPWGQIYYKEDVVGVENEEVIVCISKFKFRYYDPDLQDWVIVTDGSLPQIYAFYDKYYKVDSAGYIPIMQGGECDSKISLEEKDEYWKITFPAEYLNERVLHFGMAIHQARFDISDLYLISECKIWCETDNYKGKLASNMGCDIKMSSLYENRTREYLGGRYIEITEEAKNVCVAYVNSKTQLLRNIESYDEVIAPAYKNVVKISDLPEKTQYGVTYSISDNVICINGTNTQMIDITLSNMYLLEEGYYTFAYKIIEGSIEYPDENTMEYVNYNGEIFDLEGNSYPGNSGQIHREWFQHRNEVKFYGISYKDMKSILRSKIKFRANTVFNNVKLQIWGWKGQNVGSYQECIIEQITKDALKTAIIDEKTYIIFDNAEIDVKVEENEILVKYICDENHTFAGTNIIDNDFDVIEEYTPNIVENTGVMLEVVYTK